MRSQALELAKLNRPDLMVLDVGAGTGFTTEGLIKKRQSKMYHDAGSEPSSIGTVQAESVFKSVQKNC